MTLQQQNAFVIPQETARVARAAYPPRTDEAMTEVIHTDLQQADFLPNEHLLDGG